MTTGGGNDVGGAKQYVESDMCEQKHGEVLRQLKDHKEILLEIKGLINPRVIRNENGVKANKSAIKDLKKEKKSGRDLFFKILNVVMAAAIVVLTVVALKG